MAFEAEFGDEHAEKSGRRLIVVAGPTGVGKTMLGVELAKRFGGEVINADSRYLYRGFNIGTAKPSADEQQGMPHHLIDILDPVDDFSLARYQELTNAAIEDVLQRGRLPLLVGGTPLYVNAVIEGWKIPKVPPQPEIRQRLEREADVEGVEAFSARLAEIDPVAAERSGVNLRRIIRALEIFEVTGERMSDLEGKGPRPYQTLELGLSLSRPLLHDRLDRRVDDQVRLGLVEEVANLLEAGVPRDAPAMSSIGYRQLLPYLDGEQTLDETIAQLKHDTHRYVRHQETWLRRNQRLQTIDVSQPDWVEHAVELAAAFVDGDSYIAPVVEGTRETL
jgi:tRNA dimethylallyltransferase